MHRPRTSPPRLSRTLRTLVAATLLTLAGSALAWHGKDVSGADYGRDFSLRDHEDRPRTLADYRGKVVLMSFGYLQCPNFCPLTLAKQAAVLRRMGDAARGVQVLFVTLDPERDRPEVLKEYVSAFDPRFAGLRPAPGETRDFALAFRVYYEVVQDPTRGTYDIDHSTFSYAYDAAGRIRLVIPFDQPDADIAADLLALMREGEAARGN